MSAPQDRMPAVAGSCGDGPAPLAGDIGALVFGAADGDRPSWDALVSAYHGLLSSITTAHRLTESDAAQVRSTVWRRLERQLDKLRQPDQVGAWLAAVARDECVKVLTASSIGDVLASSG